MVVRGNDFIQRGLCLKRAGVRLCKAVRIFIKCAQSGGIDCANGKIQFSPRSRLVHFNTQMVVNKPEFHMEDIEKTPEISALQAASLQNALLQRPLPFSINNILHQVRYNFMFLPTLTEFWFHCGSILT